MAWKDLPFCIFGICGLVGSATALILPETLKRDLPQSIAEADEISKFGISFKHHKNQSHQMNSRQELNMEYMKDNKNAESF